MKTIAFVNGIIHTSWQNPATVEALLLKGDKIAWAGPRDLMPAADKVVDLGGAVLGPGLTDAHLHFINIATSRLETFVEDPSVKTIGDVLGKLREGVDKLQPTDWAVASGFDENRLNELRYPTRAEIDAVFPERPVLIRRFCGHAVVANSAAFAAVGIDDSIADPVGGVFGRDEAGRLDGSAREAAAGMILRARPQVERSTLMAALRDVMQDAASMGIVAAVEAATGGDGGRFDFEYAAWMGLRESGQPLPVRMGFMHRLDATEAKRRNLRPQKDPMFQEITLKFFADGIMGARTAAVSDEYADGTGHGLFMRDEDELRKALIAAHCDGWQVAVHSVGDKAIRLVLESLLTAQTMAPRPDARHRIEHASLSTAQDYTDMKLLGVSIVTQPSFLSRMNRSKRSAFGERVHGYYQAQTILDAGVTYVPSSDSPTGSLSPWDGIADAMDRGATTGEPIGPMEALPAPVVLAGYAEGGAYVMGQDSWRGQLRPGMAADLIVVDRDITKADAAAMRGTNVLLTMVDGRAVHDRLETGLPR